MTRIRTSRARTGRPMIGMGLIPFAFLALLPAVPAAPPAAPSAAPAPAATDPLALDKKLLAEARNGSEIMANLTYLSDVIGPRLTGSPALKQANEWTAEKMRSYGLSNVHLEGWTIPVGWERGTASLRLVEPGSGRSLTAAALGWTPPTKAPIVGDVVIVKARNSAELAPYKGKLKNAIVLRGEPAKIRPVTEKGFGFDRPPRAAAAPTDAPKPGDKPDARTETPVPPRADRAFPGMAFRRELEEFLRHEGAAAVLMDSNKPHGLLTMTGNWRGDDRVSGAEPLPSLFVTHEHYALLYRLASRPAPARTRVEVEVNCKFIPGPVPVYNTVGEIPGTDKPDEYVVLGAHLDSWDLGQGTTDNGTGTSVVLEAARILVKSGVRPRRTIRFVLFTGEEQGLHGSREYVKKHQAEMAKTSMALVHDTGTGRVVGIGLQGRAVIKPILEKELVSLKELGVTEIDMRGMGGSDHMSFERAGVPGFAVRQDPAEYRFSHHSQSDTLDKAREPDLIQGAQVLAVAGLRVANLPDLLPRDKPASEQRPRRGAERPAEPAVKPAGVKKQNRPSSSHGTPRSAGHSRAPLFFPSRCCVRYRVFDGTIVCRFVALHAPHTPCNEMRTRETTPETRRNSLSQHD